MLAARTMLEIARAYLSGWRLTIAPPRDTGTPRRIDWSGPVPAVHRRGRNDPQHEGRDRPSLAEARIGESRADNDLSLSQTITLQPLAAPLTGVRSYSGWMYLGEPMNPLAAAQLRPTEVISLPGVPIATAHERRLPDTTAVIFAVYATALDISELEGLPRGSMLLLDGDRNYQITGTRVATPPAPTRITMFQR